MVEIIHDATKENDAPLTAICSKCRSLLRYRPSETRKVFDRRDGDARVFTCPVCSKDVWVSEQAHYRRMLSMY